MSTAKTFAFIGATGGCTNSCLAHLLLSDLGYKAIALARTPQKLIDSLLRQPGITESIIADKLTIIQGDAMSVADMKKILLVPQNAQENTTTAYGEKTPGAVVVDGIVSGVGAVPSLEKGKLLSVKFDNPNITEKSSTTLITALREIYAERDQQQKVKKPILAVVSTTGITEKDEKRDVPCLFKPGYHYLLATPHEDKKKMEAIITSAENQALFKAVVITKPALLTGDGNLSTAKGLTKIRIGTEEDPAVGYFISRADVGEFLWEEVCKKEEPRWFGKKVTLAN
jgi:stage V sporulation protein SpoVS